MTRMQFVSEWINKRNEKIKVFQVDSSAKEFELVGPGKISSHFFGNYSQLIKKLIADGYQSRTRHESETIDNFMDKIISEVELKPGQKKVIPKNINVELSPTAKKALNGDPKTAEERKKIELELEKHGEEFKKLNTLLNSLRKKQELLKKKQKSLGLTITPYQAKYFSIIEKECSQFVSEMKKAKRLLFRGIDAKHDVFYGKPHVNRIPTDTNSGIQRKIDKLLLIAGFKALRSNSIFATSSVGQAEEYGEPFFIFPKNGYSFTWSSKHSDWVPDLQSLGIKTVDWTNINYDVIEDFIDIISNLDEVFETYDNPENKILIKKIKNYPNYKNVIKTLNNVGGTIENLEDDEELEEKYVQSLADAFTLLITIQEKLNFKWPNLKISKIKQMNRVIEIAKEHSKKNKTSKTDALSFITKNGLKNTDMVAALKSGHEVYINGEYIALNASEFAVAVNKFFLNKDVEEDDFE